MLFWAELVSVRAGVAGGGLWAGVKAGVWLAQCCSYMYFFLGTRALNVAVFLLEIVMGLGVGLGAGLRGLLLGTMWLEAPPVFTSEPPLASSVFSPPSTGCLAVCSRGPSFFGMSALLIASLCESPEIVRVCLRTDGVGGARETAGGGPSWFSLLSFCLRAFPSRGGSGAPLLLPPRALVDGGDLPPCFFNCLISLFTVPHTAQVTTSLASLPNAASCTFFFFCFFSFLHPVLPFGFFGIFFNSLFCPCSPPYCGRNSTIQLATEKFVILLCK